MAKNTKGNVKKLWGIDRRFIGLLVLLAATLAMTTLVWMYQARIKYVDEQYTLLTSRQQVLSERIGARASEIIRMDTNAQQGQDGFSALRTAAEEMTNAITLLKQGNKAENLPPVPAAIATQVETVEKTWVSSQKSLNQILAVNNLFSAAKTHNNELARHWAKIKKELDQLKKFTRTSGNMTQHTLALELAEQYQIINEQLGSLWVDQLNNDANIQQSLAAALLNVREGIQGLTRGGREVQALPEGSPARQPVIRLAQAYNDWALSVQYFIDNGGAIQEAGKSLPTLLTAMSSLNDALTQQQQALKAEIDHRLVNDRVLTLLGFVSLALLALVIFIMGSWIRGLVSNAQSQTQRNQDAIMRLLDEMGGLAEGDLSVQATVTEDITGAIADSVNYAIEALRELVQTINNTAESVANSAGDSHQNASRLVKASAAQTHQIQAATNAIATMVRSIAQVSDNAQRSSKVAQQSVQIAAKGSQAVRRTIDGMDGIREQIQETSKRIKRLGESSQEIGNIIELIDDIAEQTNILALNAALQAAAAGEAGRGFAVVADEVQRLAERSANATKQIEALVRTIQSDTIEAIGSMEKSTSGVVQGAKVAEDAGNALDEIEQVSNQIATLVQSISDAARQQTTQASEVSGNMRTIQEITVQASHDTRATGEAISRLAKLAAELRRSVAGFKLPGAKSV